MLKIDDVFESKFVITDKVYNGFIDIFGDKNPLHVNRDFALKKGFKGRVMFGNILNGFLSYFIGECLPIKNVIIHSQTIKYSKAVYLNDKLDFKAKVVGVYDSVNVIEFKYYFYRNGEKMAVGKVQIGIIEDEI